MYCKTFFFSNIKIDGELTLQNGTIQKLHFILGNKNIGIIIKESYDYAPLYLVLLLWCICPQLTFIHVNVIKISAVEFILTFSSFMYM